MELMQTIADRMFDASTRRQAVLCDGVLIVAGSALVAACAKVQAPAWPVPMTMQPFAVLLVGALLGARRGGLALVLYLLEGFAGFPVFALPGAGPGYFVGPTAGYLLAFPAAALCVGYLAERGWDRTLVRTVCAFALGQLMILSMGAAWASGFVGWRVAMETHVFPFLLGDVLKIGLAAVALPAAWRMICADATEPV